jgi:hypothetical protein
MKNETVLMKAGINIPERLRFFKGLGRGDGRKRQSLSKRGTEKERQGWVIADAGASTYRLQDALKTPKRFGRIPVAFESKSRLFDNQFRH